jgi:hypothetical protein
MHLHHRDEFDIDGRFDLFFVNYTVVNGSDQQLAAINGGGTNVDAFSYKDGVTLTNTELAALLNGSSFGHKDVAVFADQTGDAQKTQKKRAAALAALYVST